MLTKAMVRRESRVGYILDILVDSRAHQYRLLDCARRLLRVCGLLLVQLGRVIKTRDEVCQTFSLDQNVLPEQSLRLVAVSGTDRVDNTLMFR